MRRSPAEVQAAREAKLDEMAEKLETAVAGLTTGEDWKRAIEFAARFRSRSFRNTLLIYAQHTDAYEQGRVSTPVPTYVAGFNQWKQLDRSVDKGQSGYMIYAPVMGRFASKDPSDPMSWRRLQAREKPAAGEVVRSRIVNVKPAYVWDVTQTSGSEIPERPMPRLLEGEAPAGLWAGLAAQVATEGFELQDAVGATSIWGANGVTIYDTKVVAVRADMDDAARVKTLAHELGHVRMHDPAEAVTHHRGIREVEAESVAITLIWTVFIVFACLGWTRIVQRRVAMKVQVVDDASRVFPLEIEQALQLPPQCLSPSGNNVPGVDRPLTLVTRISDESGRTAHQSQRVMPGHLQMAHDFHRHEMTVMKRGSCRIEAAIVGDLSRVQRFSKRIDVGVLGNQPTPLKFVEDVSHVACLSSAALGLRAHRQVCPQ